MIALLLALAGGVGAGTRFVVDGAVRRRWAVDFPVGTLLINVGGSLLLGLLTGLVLFHEYPADIRLVLGTGFCGGFTTFSTASFETVRLVQQRLVGRAALYAFGSLGITVLAGAAGLVLAHL